MKTSVMLFPYHQRMVKEQSDLDQLLDMFAACGVGAVEPMAGYAGDDPAAWAALCAAMKRRGMVCSCFDVGANLVTTDAESRQQVLERVKNAIRFAVDTLQAPNIMLYGSKQAEGMDIPTGRRIYGEMLGECAELAEGTGTRVCFEDFGAYRDFAAAADACMEVLSHAGDKVGFVFDNGNFLLGGDRPADIFDRCRSRICHVHIKDFRMMAAGEPGGFEDVRGNRLGGIWIGKGIAQVRECIALLKGSGYDGWYSEENHSDRFDESAYGLGVMNGCY